MDRVTAACQLTDLPMLDSSTVLLRLLLLLRLRQRGQDAR